MSSQSVSTVEYRWVNSLAKPTQRLRLQVQSQHELPIQMVRPFELGFSSQPIGLGVYHVELFFSPGHEGTLAPGQEIILDAVSDASIQSAEAVCEDGEAVDITDQFVRE